MIKWHALATLKRHYVGTQTQCSAIQKKTTN